jgi:hypothetical protein
MTRRCLFRRLLRHAFDEARPPVKYLTERECRAMDFAYGAMAALSMVGIFTVIFLLVNWRQTC